MNPDVGAEAIHVEDSGLCLGTKIETAALIHVVLDDGVGAAGVCPAADVAGESAGAGDTAIGGERHIERGANRTTVAIGLHAEVEGSAGRADQRAVDIRVRETHDRDGGLRPAATSTVPFYAEFTRDGPTGGSSAADGLAAKAVIHHGQSRWVRNEKLSKRERARLGDCGDRKN